MTFEEYKTATCEKCIAIGITTEDEALLDYNNFVAQESAQIKKEIAKKTEKTTFLENAVKVLGKNVVIECFIETRKTKKNAIAAIAGDTGFSKLTQDEIEYQLSIIN